ncbi:MAG: histidinol dehydrogenase, partial [Myxococcota bacterium]
MAVKKTAKPMRVMKADAATFVDDWQQVCARREDPALDVAVGVAKIISALRSEGDKALFRFIKKFDHAELKTVEVANDEWDDACDAVDSADRAAIGTAAMRIRAFHRKRIPSSWEMREEGGGFMGQRVRPLTRVGLYVPGGKAIYPSSVLMNAIPASVVEVPEIIMATPPGADGSIRPEVLMAARVAGVHRVFKMGGAHAIAAMAYGTESVPRVDKIVGPGNIYVATAKKMVFGRSEEHT